MSIHSISCGGLISSSGTLAGANTMRFSSKTAILSTTGAWGFYDYGYRFYDPGMQRWLNRDPIEEEGGLNLYGFVAKHPAGIVDVFGLKAWKCIKPLHALGGKGGRSGPDVPGNPLYHEYYCVETNGKISCFAQDRQDGPWSPGKPSVDSFDPKNCKGIPSNSCIEACLHRKGREKRPNYGLLGPGINCQEWANSAIAACSKECESKKCPSNSNTGVNSPPATIIQ